MAEKIRVGVIGTGFGVEVQIPSFQLHPDTEVVAVCSAHLERAKEAAARFGLPYAFADYRAMVALPDLDLVSVVTPPHLHYPMTMAALEAGKHVLCEKPMAMDAAEARTMLQRAEDASVVHMIAFEHRFTTQRAWATELIGQGYLGEPRFAVVRLFAPSPVGPSPDRWGWVADRSQGGGILNAIGSHYIDALRSWFGEVTAVCGSTAILAGSGSADDSFEFQLRLQSGVRASMTASTALATGSGVTTELTGAEGCLVLPQGDSFFPPRDGKVLGRRRGESELHELPMPEAILRRHDVPGDRRIRSFLVLVNQLVTAIRGGEQQGPTFVDGLRCQEVTDAVRASSEAGCWIRLGQDGTQ